jgi:hypothetical protein
MRGAGIIEWLAWQDGRFGKAISARAAAHVPEALRVHFDASKPHLGLDPQIWYPVEAFHALLDVVTSNIDQATLDPLVDEAARVTMQALLARFMRSFESSLSSTERFARVVNAVWRLMFDTGRVQVLSPGPRALDLVIADWSGHHPVMCRFTNMCTVAIFERMGHSQVKVVPSCVSRGASTCGALTRW